MPPKRSKPQAIKFENVWDPLPVSETAQQYRVFKKWLQMPMDKRSAKQAALACGVTDYTNVKNWMRSKAWAERAEAYDKWRAGKKLGGISDEDYAGLTDHMGQLLTDMTMTGVRLVRTINKDVDESEKAERGEGGRRLTREQKLKLLNTINTSVQKFLDLLQKKRELDWKERHGSEAQEAGGGVFNVEQMIMIAEKSPEKANEMLVTHGISLESLKEAREMVAASNG